MFMSLLNIVTECAFGVIACLQGGQALNAVSKGSLPVALELSLWGLCLGWLQRAASNMSQSTRGESNYFYNHNGLTLICRRYMWVLPVIVYIALCAVGRKYFEIPPPVGTQSTTNKGGLALSYLSLQIRSGLGWAAVSADYVSCHLRSFSIPMLINRTVRLFS